MSDATRELGIEFGYLRQRLLEWTYPATKDELIDEYADEEVTLSRGTRSFKELISPLNQDEYGSYDDVEQAMMNMVGEEAIGRKNYSDRTPYAPGEERQDEGAPGQYGYREQESF